jgi:WbqC-like protein family
MKTAIMQPYFFPYIGYFQLIASVDLFVVYDNIKYTKRGWINRNRVLLNGKDVMLSLPLKGGSDNLDVREKTLATDFRSDHLLNQLCGTYRNAPHFKQTFPLIERILRQKERNLFNFLHTSITLVCQHLEIATKIKISSDISIDHDAKKQNKVLAICRALGTDTYVNAIGGIDLYSQTDFLAAGINLQFARSKPFVYPQFGGEFVPCLSIIDVMMFNPLSTIKECVHTNYDLIEPPRDRS